MIDPLKIDLFIKAIDDNSSFDTKKKEAIQKRKVTLIDSENAVKITLTEIKQYHPLKSLDNKADLNLGAKITLIIGDQFQKKLEDSI